MQRGIFEMTAGLTRSYLTQAQGTLPAHVLFPQLLPIVERFVRHHVFFPANATLKQLFTNRCTDCHSQIHGTDTPSQGVTGPGTLRQ